MIGFRFWQKWLVVLGLMITLTMGIFFTFSHLLNIEYSYINLAFWGSQTAPLIVADFQDWIYGVYGAIATTFGLFIIFIASIPFKRKEPWSWYCLVSCISVWFVLDTSISLGFKFYTNAIFNLIFFILLMLPLAFTRNHIFNRIAKKTFQQWSP